MDLREQRILTYMGKPVHVVVDRPIGYQHGNLVYPINYGYIPGLMAGDGEEQDVYVLGVAEPMKAFRGRIIAAICRADDNEDKLVAAPEGMTFTAEEIREATWFVEQYFDSTVRMAP